MKSLLLLVGSHGNLIADQLYEMDHILPKQIDAGVPPEEDGVTLQDKLYGKMVSLPVCVLMSQDVNQVLPGKAEPEPRQVLLKDQGASC